MTVGRMQQEIDISQHAILEKLIAYSDIMGLDSSYLTDGHCVGFTILALYAKWLELTQPRRQDNQGQWIPRDDWPWLYAAWQNISRWDGKRDSLSQSSRKAQRLREDLARILSLTKYYQNLDTYCHTSQVEISRNLQDTRGRSFNKLFSLGALLTPADMIKPISVRRSHHKKNTTLINEIMKDDSLVIISGAEHVVGVIHHRNTYYLYDSNESDGWRKYSKGKVMDCVNAFFEDLDFDQTAASAIGFYVACNGKRPGNEDVAYALLNALGKKKEVYSKDASHYTGLHMAVEMGSRGSVKYHLRHPPINCKEYVNLLDDFGNTALHYAAKYGYADIALDLIHHGTEVDLQGNFNRTALYNAIKNRHIKIASDLLASGANPDIKSKCGTPLCRALKNDDLAGVQLLLNYHADANLKNDDGDAPLHIAAEKGNVQAVKCLIDNKAKINIKNAEGLTPFMLALKNKQIEVAEYLIERPALTIGLAEYDLLKRLSTKVPENKKLKAFLVKTQMDFLCKTIKQQLQSVREKAPLYYQQATSALGQAKHGQYKKKESNDKPLLLLSELLPVLEKAPVARSWLQFWHDPSLAQPVYSLALRLGFEREKLDAMTLSKARGESAFSTDNFRLC